jgi:hypothetical protein
MKNTSKKTGNNNATATLATINAQIAELQSRRVTLAEPLKERYLEMVKECGEMVRQITELDPTWKPASLKPKADAKIAEIIAANGKPMDEAAIIAAVGDTFTKWKVRQTLKKRFTVDAAGKYSVKAA